VVESARRLIDLANEAGGRDNTSVILVRVATPDSPFQDAEELAEADLDDEAEAQGEAMLQVPDPTVQ
jgi:serine/threonine protein phosphatase PrpC